MTVRSYAIGDIHGHLEKLVDVHALIALDREECGDADAPVIHIGDLVDRGPDSRGVIEFLMEGQAEGQPWIVLKGNHDRLFTGFMADPGYRDPGLRAELGYLHPRIGGDTTLASYGVRSPGDRPIPKVHADAAERIPAAHLEFERNLPLYHLRGEVLYVHAGVRPGVDLRNQREDDLIWIRHEFLDDTRDHGPLIVHGHTAIAEATHYGNRLNIDSSAAYGGPLTAVVIEDRNVWRLTAAGRVALEPLAVA